MPVLSAVCDDGIILSVYILTIELDARRPIRVAEGRKEAAMKSRVEKSWTVRLSFPPAVTCFEASGVSDPRLADWRLLPD